MKRTNNYIGMDVSSGMLDIARKKVKGAEFVEADAAAYDMPEDLDIIFAFASLLHLRKDEVEKVLDRGHKALKPGGIFYISLKHQDEYVEEIKDDRFGTRQFFFYTPELIGELAAGKYETIHKDFQTIGRTKWFTMALRNIS